MKVTMSDIAARAGTTVGVVSVTLNGGKSKTVRASEATRARVIKVAEELGYRRDPRGSALVTGRTHVIGLMLPYVQAYSVPDPFYSLVTTGVSYVASRLGFNVMLYTTAAEEEGTRAAEAIDRRIDGLVLVAPPPVSPIYEECRRQGIAVVSITQRPESDIFTVNSSDYEGGRLATQHLIDLGHRRIAHLSGTPEVYTSRLRYQAYVDALACAGLTTDPELTREGRFNREFSRAEANEFFRLPKDRRPTAIFAANDMSAHGAVDAICEAGLRVPEDVSVVGYDDTWYALLTNPPLTSVNMNIDLLGRRAAEVLIGTIEGSPQENHSVLPVSLTVRRSSGPSPSPSIY